MVKMISTPRKINAILLNIKINQPTLANICGYKLSKFHGNILSLSKSIAKSLGGGGLVFLTAC